MSVTPAQAGGRNPAMLNLPVVARPKVATISIIFSPVIDCAGYLQPESQATKLEVLPDEACVDFVFDKKVERKDIEAGPLKVKFYLTVAEL